VWRVLFGLPKLLPQKIRLPLFLLFFPQVT
jgi:hypothetical protein